MSDNFADQLHWIDTQQEQMVRLVATWSSINSWSYNLDGLARMGNALVQEFEILDGQIQHVELAPQSVVDANGNVVDKPLGKAIQISKRPDAPVQVLLAIHMDTVHRPGGLPETRLDDQVLHGPGVADAKGGLAVMLVALQAFEQSPLRNHVGWQVLINPDEEIGSPGSSPLLVQAAARHHLGLVFEPTLPDGTLIAARKGSGNFTVVLRGRSAHVGRHAEQGRNAIDAMADLIVALRQMAQQDKDITLNVGRVEGGGPVNVVPNLAICRFNVRVIDKRQQQWAAQGIAKIIDQLNDRDGLNATLHGQFQSPPKTVDAPTRALMDAVTQCGRQLAIDVPWQDSGGVCDGNKLAAAGLVNIDTLGPQGGNLHNDKEYLLVSSLTQRAKLTALLMMKLATGQLNMMTTKA